MNFSIQPSPDDRLPAAQVLARYGVCEMTLYRWLGNTGLDFPKPIRINGRRYWRLGDLQAFEARQANLDGAGKLLPPIMSGE